MDSLFIQGNSEKSGQDIGRTSDISNQKGVVNENVWPTASCKIVLSDLTDMDGRKMKEAIIINKQIKNQWSMVYHIIPQAATCLILFNPLSFPYDRQKMNREHWHSSPHRWLPFGLSTLFIFMFSVMSLF